MIEMFITWSAGNWKRRLAVFVIIVNTALSAVLLMTCAVSGLGILKLDARAILNGCVLGYVLSCIIGVLVSAVQYLERRIDVIWRLRKRIWRWWVRLRFLFTGNCGCACGVATFRKLDGTPFQQFVPEADCPIHDIFPIGGENDQAGS